jgi:hypothetical protein
MFKSKSSLRRLLELDELTEPKEIAKDFVKEQLRPLPGRACKIVEQNPFKRNDELPETDLYFGGQSETEHDLRILKISQREEMARL